MAVSLEAAAWRNGRSSRSRIAPGDGPHQAGADPLTAEGRIGAHRADLRPAGRVEPLACHGDERALRTQTQVGAHLDSPGKKRPGPSPLDQGQHLGHVGRVEEAEIGVARRARAGSRPSARRVSRRSPPSRGRTSSGSMIRNRLALPAAGRAPPRTTCPGRPPRRRKGRRRAGSAPPGRRRPPPDRPERVRRGQRTPDRVVEGMCVDRGGGLRAKPMLGQQLVGPDPVRVVVGHGGHGQLVGSSHRHESLELVHDLLRGSDDLGRDAVGDQLPLFVRPDVGGRLVVGRERDGSFTRPDAQDPQAVAVGNLPGPARFRLRRRRLTRRCTGVRVSARDEKRRGTHLRRRGSWRGSRGSWRRNAERCDQPPRRSPLRCCPGSRAPRPAPSPGVTCTSSPWDRYCRAAAPVCHRSAECSPALSRPVAGAGCGPGPGGASAGAARARAGRG